jgi:hypothetical protein
MWSTKLLPQLRSTQPRLKRLPIVPPLPQQASVRSMISIVHFDNLSTEIAEEMDKVNQASAKISRNCSNINNDAEKINRQTGKVDDLIHKFVIE